MSKACCCSCIMQQSGLLPTDLFVTESWNKAGCRLLVACQPGHGSYAKMLSTVPCSKLP